MPEHQVPEEGGDGVGFGLGTAHFSGLFYYFFHPGFPNLLKAGKCFCCIRGGIQALRKHYYITDHKYVDILFRHGAMTAGELAEHAGLTTGAVTGVIDRLEKAGLVRRERDPADRRKVVVVLDEEGARERISPAFQHMQQGLGQLYEGFSDQELGVVKRYLESTIAFYEGQIKEQWAGRNYRTNSRKLSLLINWYNALS